MRIYKTLSTRTRDIKTIKIDDLDIRLVRHYLGNRVEAHLQAETQEAAKQASDEIPLYRYRDLLGHLSTLTGNIVNFSDQQIEKITTPTSVQDRAFGLLGVLE